MTRMLAWIWDRGIVSTFLSGLFVILPLVITIAIMGWMGGKVRQWVGPQSQVGAALRSLGLRFATDETVASILGWTLALAGIWLLGALVRALARYRIEGMLHRAVGCIPIMKSIYGPVSQVVGLLRQQDQGKLASMSVVFCTFGPQSGAGFLGLLASPGAYRFDGQDCHVVYIPTSPIPMSGGIVFVPVGSVHFVDMSVDTLMQIYFSMGVMTSKVVPARYHPPAQTP